MEKESNDPWKGKMNDQYAYEKIINHLGEQGIKTGKISHVSDGQN